MIHEFTHLIKEHIVRHERTLQELLRAEDNLLQVLRDNKRAQHEATGAINALQTILKAVNPDA
jgi:hypothetical protein